MTGQSYLPQNVLRMRCLHSSLLRRSQSCFRLPLMMLPALDWWASVLSVVALTASRRPSCHDSSALQALGGGNFVSINERLAHSCYHPSLRSNFYETLSILSPCSLHFMSSHRATLILLCKFVCTSMSFPLSLDASTWVEIPLSLAGSLVGDILAH